MQFPSFQIYTTLSIHLKNKKRDQIPIY